MKDFDINKIVKDTIDRHNKGLLGKEDLINYLKKCLNSDNEDDAYDILLDFTKRISNEGYIFMNDIDHFDIAKYDKAKITFSFNIPKFDEDKTIELDNDAKKIYNKIIQKYNDSKTKLNFKNYIDPLIKSKNYTLDEEAHVRFKVINNFNNDNYTIKSIEPFLIKKRN